EKPRTRVGKTTSKPVDDKRTRQAAFDFEEEQRQRERQAQKEDAARQRRQRAIAAAQAALDEAEQDHKAKIDDIEKARAMRERKFEAERARWKNQRERLEEALRKTRSVNLRVV